MTRLRRRAIASLVFALAAAACGDDGAATCPAGLRPDADGSCTAPGPEACSQGFADGAKGCAPIVAESCAPGTRPSIGKADCVAVGVPMGACGTGFASDGMGGCAPVLPAAACPVGMLALPGETACRPVAACVAGRWGDIPITATTQFVDAAYVPGTGGPSDGTELHPWTTIQQGVAAAAAGAIVAITDGVYAEDVRIADKAVQVWGRCPSAVAVVGSAAGAATIDLLRATNAAVRGVELRGAGSSAALQVAASANVTIEKVWISSHPRRGIYAAASAGVISTIVVKDVLVEAAHEHGIFLDDAAQGTIDRAVVRDTESRTSDNKFGRGIAVHGDTGTRRGRLTLRASLLERNRDVGLFVLGSDATVDGILVRDTRPQADQMSRGWGVAVQKHPTSRLRATLTMDGSVIAGNRDLGMLVSGCTATLRRTVIRDTRSHLPDLKYGHAIEETPASVDNDAPSLEVEDSLFDANRTLALSINGGPAVLRRSIVRGTLPQESDNKAGRGIEAAFDTGAMKPASLELEGCSIEGNREVGVAYIGSSGAIRDSVIRGTRADPAGSGGRGLEVQRDAAHAAAAKVDVTGALLADNEEAGVLAAAAELTLTGSAIRRTAAGGAGHGYGVVAVAVAGSARGKIAITGSLVEASHGAGVAIAGADATLTGAVVRESAAATLPGYGIVAGTDGAVTIERCEVADNASSGAAAFDGMLALHATLLACNMGDALTAGRGALDDRSANGCGCGGDVGECRTSMATSPGTITLPAPLVPSP